VGANKKASNRGKKTTARAGRKSNEVVAKGQGAEGEREDDTIRRDFAPSPMNLLPGGASFPFAQSSLQAPPLAPPPLLPPAPYGTDMNNEFARVSNMNASSFSNISHHLSALNTFTSQQHNYPSSPESNGTVSQHSSPRFAARDMSRHGSNGSRLSMRKGGTSYNAATAAAAAAAATVAANQASHYPQEFWEALDPAAKTATSIGGQDFVSGPPSSHPNFSMPPEVSAAVALANPTSGTTSIGGNLSLNGGVTTPRGEPPRFSVPTGPLSPFSSIALTSSMSPYLSAFSNARDTPFVASPSRGGIPGTPGANSNIFDWTMRPPSKPATKRESISMQSTNSNNDSASKRKREDEEPGRIDDALLHADADERSAAALLDSLRNAGSRPMQPAALALNGETAAAAAAAAAADSPAQSSSGATVSASTVDTTPQSQQQAPSESFFEQRDVSVEPETFLLRLQGGAQEERRGSTTIPDETIAMSLGFGNNLHQFSEGAIHSLSQFGNNQRLATPPVSWESILYGSDAIPGETNNAVSSGWLMSPGIQQIINSFAVSNPGDNGSYFSGAPPASETTSGLWSQGQIQNSNPSDVSTLALEMAMADVKNPFYIPPSLFRACYQVLHWNLPPLTRLSMLALHSQQNLLKHFPIVHEPTFRLDTTPGCIAFSIAMLGCHKHGRMWWTGEEAIPKKAGKPAEVKLEANEENIMIPATRYDEEDGQELVRPIVMTDKTDKLIRRFATDAKTAQDKFAILVALTLFQANNFISADPSTRVAAAFSQTSLVTLARKAGLFDPKEAHSGRKVTYTGEEVLRTSVFESVDLCFSMSYLPALLPNCSNDERIWRRWCELAARRRTAFLVFVMDTVASLDAGIGTQVLLEEVVHFPLPTPDTIWRAPTVEAWKKGLESYYGPSLDEALTELLQPANEGCTVGPASIYGRHGPFARLIVIMALVRGVAQLLEDRKKRISRPSLLAMKHHGKKRDDVEVYKLALSRWREAWDQDGLCLAASAPAAREKAVKMGLGDGNVAWLGSHYLFASKTASGGTPLSDDALPFYWLAVILLEYAALPQGEGVTDRPVPKIIQLAEAYKPSPLNGEAKIKEEEVVATQDGLPNYRSLLRFAKAFVTSGEDLGQP
jgi:hypothetical protein